MIIKRVGRDHWEVIRDGEVIAHVTDLTPELRALILDHV